MYKEHEFQPWPSKPHIMRAHGIWRVSPMPTPDDPSAWIAALALADRLNKAQALRRYPTAPSPACEARDVGPGLLESPIFALYLAAVIVAGAILAII